MGRRIIAIAAAVLLALAGVVAVVLYAKGADQRAVASAQPQVVYVSQKLVPSGTSLDEAVRTQLLIRAEVPSRAVPLGALTSVTDANKGLLALTDITPGEYVLSARFGTTPQGSKAIQVPAGQVAISVALDDQARVGQFVTPGSRLVLFDTFTEPTTAPPGAATGATANASPANQTRVLLTDVLVIAMGSTALTPLNQPTDQRTAPPATAPNLTLVTLSVSPEDATRLVHGIQTGKLYAGLRGSDAKVATAAAVSDVSIFGK